MIAATTKVGSSRDTAGLAEGRRQPHPGWPHPGWLGPGVQPGGGAQVGGGAQIGGGAQVGCGAHSGGAAGAVHPGRGGRWLIGRRSSSDVNVVATSYGATLPGESPPGPKIDGNLASAGGSPDSFDASRLIADFFVAHLRVGQGG
jgi:hypothetical protein